MVEDEFTASAFSDDLKRQHLHISAGGLLGLLRVAREERALLERFDSLLIGGSCQVKVIGAVADFHAAIRDFSLQRWIAVQGGDEIGNFFMPRFRGGILQPIPDEKMLHG